MIKNDFCWGVLQTILLKNMELNKGNNLMSQKTFKPLERLDFNNNYFNKIKFNR